MPAGDLILGSDGKFARVIGPWAREKLHYIQRYCDTFNTAMKDKWGKRTYIDLFCGPGLCADEVTGEEFDGSPLIALKCGKPFTHYFFNDKDKRAINALRARAVSLSTNNINYFSEDCNDVIEHLLEQLPESSLDFCFIDPTNWQIKFDSIRKLTKGRRMDIVITFHTGEMKRCAHQPPDELNDFFDGADWQVKYKEVIQKGKREGSPTLLNHYKQKLKSIGYKGFDSNILVKTTTGKHLYYLLYASKDPKGAKLWHNICQTTSIGQRRLRLPREYEQ